MNWTLVTGAAKGLGAQICRHLASNGYPVVVQFRTSEHEAYQLVDECQGLGGHAEAIQGDFTTSESTANFIERYQTRFHSTFNLVNNVGNYMQGAPSSLLDEDWYTLFQTNLHAPIALTTALLPSLKENKGCVINVGVAGLGRQLSDLKATGYAMTKEALWMYTRSLANELAPSHVRVNMVSPGHLENSIVTLDPMALPMKRVGKLEEVARVVGFLLDPHSSYITGQNIDVAGGVRL